MSLSFIIVILAIVSALVGIKVYLEHKEEKILEETKSVEQEKEVKQDLPVEQPATIVVLENPIDFKTQDPEPAVEVEKKKPKKRYYGKPKKKSDKKTSDKNKIKK
jgi:hypothetical protein